MEVIKRSTRARPPLVYRQGLINAGIILGLVLVMLAISYLSKRGVTFLGWVLAGSLVAIVMAVFLTKLRRYEYGIIAIILAGGLLNFFTLPTGRGSRIVI